MYIQILQFSTHTNHALFKFYGFYAQKFHITQFSIHKNRELFKFVYFCAQKLHITVEPLSYGTSYLREKFFAP
jgi:hypothetical protein